MKTCRRFSTVRAEFEREISFMLAHAQRYEGRPSGKSSAKRATSTKQQMARALATHVGRCPECG
ncbi:hypothetical protein ACH4TM_31045 [Streptomyces parvus]|uniref:hypothetical protein n=1 Tax=Streptomyces TaxID=1883 RepID=UPI000978E2E2|nr:MULTISPECIES: hypothetical protein [unclassified Streptomyces]ONI49910.1 hypothetical protein STIB_56240 [Streptomyces sp. IB2014 011-1]RDV48489.1 hypothetical protein DDV98_26920 [Streptomyces sp. IB2014 011-12]WSV19735.1 hypothetical protein OG554_04840 [Streptomyces fimicarius]